MRIFSARLLPVRCFTLGLALAGLAIGSNFPYGTSRACAEEPIDVWPGLAPGEATRSTGQTQPSPPGETRPITRLVGITRPTLQVFPAATPNGTAVVILPGGGFVKVVPDLEGSEAAQWLNELGITAFVLNYRTKNEEGQSGWERPLQDAQRALSLVRSQAARWDLNPERIGLLGFSAGGQIAARLLSEQEQRRYAAIDAIDRTPYQPNFAILVYPWNIYDSQQDRLIDGVSVAPNAPPTFLVHTHDDRSSSLGAVLYYAELKKRDIPSELHVYGNGGHGYGTRPVAGSQISTWTLHAGHWLAAQGLCEVPAR